MTKITSLGTLVARLRELEANALRLSAEDMTAFDRARCQTYRSRLDRLDQSHSHSWFGDHASTYYGNFEPPPGGRSFDVEWGFLHGFRGPSNPGWRIFSRKEVMAFVFADIGEDTFDTINTLATRIGEEFSNIRDQALDVLEALSERAPSKALARYMNSVEGINSYTMAEYVSDCLASTPNMTRDSEEIAKGKKVPAHVQYLAPIKSLEANQLRLRDIAGTLRKVIEAVNLSNEVDAMQSRTVFVGHGKSVQWLVLKDFLKDRLGLSVEEFNRISAAGISTQERLSEMLNECGFAFLVLTAEDMHADSSMHARENVIHEAGLFQGRLGWRRAVVLLEQDCDEFTNIVGLGQIRFNKGNIPSCFEEIRRVLEREGFLSK